MSSPSSSMSNKSSSNPVTPEKKEDNIIMEEEKELKLNQTPKEEVIAAIARTATASPPTIVLSTPAPTKKSHQQGQSQPSSIAAPTPPPEAFQSLPLSSGTIHPPSSANATPANLPFVEDGSVNPTSHSTTVMMENIEDAKNDEEDVEAGGLGGTKVLHTVLGALDEVLVAVSTVTLHHQQLAPLTSVLEEQAEQTNNT